jgi:chemotaxis signal transduction protein
LNNFSAPTRKKVPDDAKDLNDCQVQLLRVGSFLFGLPTREISTIAEWRKPAPLPHASSVVCGVVSIQGRMLTVLAPIRLFDQQASDDAFSPSYIVALRGDEQLALAVDSVEDVEEISPGQLETAGQAFEPFVLGLLKRGDRPIRVLDVKKLFLAAIQGRERRQRQF